MSLYNILEVSETATTEEIRAAYRQLVKKYHPDTEGGDELMFRALKGAHDVLIDPERRKRYDETGETEQAPDTTDAEAIAAIDGWLTSILDDENAHFSDAVGLMLRKCSEERKAAVEHAALGGTLEARTTKLRARFIKKNPEQRDIIGGLFDQKLQMIRAARESAERAPNYGGIEQARSTHWNTGPRNYSGVGI